MDHKISVFTVQDHPLGPHPRKRGSTSENGINLEVKDELVRNRIPTTYFETLVHLLKATFGTGILAIPHAYREAGWLVSSIGTVVVGTICTYAVHMLLQSETTLKHKRKDTQNLTYHRLAQMAVEEGPTKFRWLAPYIPFTSRVFFVIGQLGSSCIYVVFICSQIKSIVDFYQDPESRLDIKWYMLIMTFPLILINWVRNLKYLAPFSSVGTAATLTSFAIIIYYMFQDLPSISTIDAVGSPSGFITFFTTVLFALESIGAIMPLKNEMKYTHQFGSKFGVLNMAMVPNIIMFLIFGFFGYLRFGSEVQSSISLSLPDSDKLAQASRVLLIVSIFISHPLQLYMAFDIVWNEYLGPKVKKNRLVIEYTVRTTLVIFTIVFAMIIPHLDLIISLIGALCLSTLGLTFPSTIHLFTHWYDESSDKNFWWYTIHYFIIIIGCVALVFGTTSSLSDIIAAV